MPEYEAVIAMEVHVQLRTRSKMFCGCSAQTFGAAPNTATCPVCLGLPGALPVPNRAAVEQAIRAGLALNCRIAEHTMWERKNYFYPDLPKGYQISQYQVPLCYDGWIEIEVPDASGRLRTTQRVGITRAHLEEDTARLVHAGEHSLLDFNRAGVPLLEIVSEPDLRTSEEARQFLVTLRTLLRTLGVSTADMEQGAMRCEPNVSLRPVGQEALGTKVEIKNLNSFRAVKQAVDYEIQRQAQILAAHGPVRQVTMNWDERSGRTVLGRVKESADDYRYFPEPDIPPVRIPRAWVDDVRTGMPELPGARRTRFVTELGLAWADATTLVADAAIADWFERAVEAGRRRGVEPRTLSHWVTGELFRLMNDQGLEIDRTRVTPGALVALVTLVERGVVSASVGKEVLAEVAATGQAPDAIVEARGLARISDRETLAQVVEHVIASHPDEVAAYRAGKEPLLRWFVGQVMQATHGRADVQRVMVLLREELEGRGS
jgi:aspartyl-tRNA(Asn)/glutamyl-tRNA(Gln) amidotransferase subunit B